MTPQDGDRDGAVKLVAKIRSAPPKQQFTLTYFDHECVDMVVEHTRAAVERETAQLRAELATWKDSFSNAIEQAHNDVNKEKEAHAETLRMERQAHERIGKLEGTVAQLRGELVGCRRALETGIPRLELVSRRLRNSLRGQEWTERNYDADIIALEVLPLIRAALAPAPAGGKP